MRKGFKKHNNAIRVEVDGIKFPSKAEAARYLELKVMQQSGTIRGLRLQPPYPLVVNGQKICKYIADFEYQERGVTVVEDVKGRRLDVYVLKSKLFKALYPHLEFRELSSWNYKLR